MIVFFIQVATIATTIVLIMLAAPTNGQLETNRFLQLAYEILVMTGTALWGRDRLYSLHPLSAFLFFLTFMNLVLLIHRIIEMKKDHDLFGN